MKIKKIEIENFRSIKKYEIDCSNYNVYIGQNNHGKTNFFEALSWFDSGKIKPSDYYNYDKELEIKIRVHYCDVQLGIAGIQNPRYKTTIENKVGVHDEIIIEKSSSTNKRTMIVAGENVGNPTGFDTALNYFLPKIEYVTTSTRLGDVSGYKSKSPIAEMLSGVLEDIIENDTHYQDFIDLFDKLFHGEDSIFRQEVSLIEEKVEFYLQKQFAEGATVDFKIDNPQLSDMLKGFETYVDDGIKTTAEEKGDGMKRAIMLAIIQSYSDYRKDKGIARNFVFLIDEAELHLHPSAQRSLKKALGDIVENGGQIFINSHSSVFAVDEFENQFVYEVHKENGISSMKKIITEQEKLDAIYNMLGGSPADLLLPRNFLIVEGQSEYHFLQRIIERFYSEEAKNIKIIFARGDIERQFDVYYKIAEIYTPLHTNGVYREKVVFLLDKPNNSQLASYDMFKEVHDWLIEGEHLNTLEYETLEEAYPGNWKKERDEIDYKEKVPYAIEVANKLTESEFQKGMPTVYNALMKVISKAF